MKVALETLGCKLNQAETELLARQLVEAGHSLVSRADEADVYIVNTCTVTDTADGKSRRLLRAAHRRNPGALLVATGCYAQRVPEELARLEGVGLVVGNDGKPELLRLLRESGCSNDAAFIQSDPAADSSPALRTRAFIKIQDGCKNFCSYCIVPLVRRREYSLPADRVIAEVRERVAEGYQEVVLTGTEVGAYNDDGVGLEALLEKILAGTGVARLRLSSLQPDEVSPRLIRLWRDGRLCPHFHLSLQSGSDAVLKRMKRRYGASDYQEAVALIRDSVPDVAITTDIIVGFPGETDEEFEESYQLCHRLQFARIHIFPYSRRSGTKAARLPHQVSAPVKDERRRKMLALAEESAQNFRQRFTGKVMPVLWEQQSNGVWSGFTANYIRVSTRSNEDLTNKLLPATVT